MPVAPLVVKLTDWQKRDTIKRLRETYHEEFMKVEAELTELLMKNQEADLLAAYVGEQAEIKAMRSDPQVVALRSQRREYLWQLIERLDSIVKELPAVQAPAPGSAGLGGNAGQSRIKRF